MFDSVGRPQTATVVKVPSNQCAVKEFSRRGILQTIHTFK